MSEERLKGSEINYSVLMSVYFKENPEYFKEAIESIFNQTHLTNDFVLVCDGPLNFGLDKVIEEYQSMYPQIFNVYRIEKNLGLGEALNFGLSHCKNELVARMDTDDISLPDRCENELLLFKENPKLALVSGPILEFLDNPKIVTGKRNVPKNLTDIIEFSKKRNPFNHPAVMFKKSIVVAVGGYDEEYHLFEDYYLWVRILKRGYNAKNLDKPLLLMRTPSDLYLRRGGWKYAKDLLRFNNWMLSINWIKTTDYLTSSLPHAIVCILPNKLRKLIYLKLHS
ncbi:glycosyltransferase [Streptococcus parauberis]|uniref:glycosyltransferase n=1 Tax=Streptococcus parauberis TaxID=1348 RepID=UPI000CCE35B0|nr:glycosyltransferase [Streptococcus parauberis]PNY18950.1 UDP-Gal:alpha-D-GlcNAc-diphosphoundecaprenol beta-1,3-galactosyltransferase [Streptococcus parauberis]